MTHTKINVTKEVLYAKKVKKRNETGYQIQSIICHMPPFKEFSKYCSHTVGSIYNSIIID